MKKIILLILLAVCLLVLEGCGSRSDKRDLHWETGERLTIDDFLYDLDFFMAGPNENFSFLGIGYRRGMDISSLFVRTREELLAIENIGMDDFIYILDNELLRHTRRLGHLRMLSQEDYIGFEVSPNNVYTHIFSEYGFAYLTFSWFPVANME